MYSKKVSMKRTPAVLTCIKKNIDIRFFFSLKQNMYIEKKLLQFFFIFIINQAISLNFN